MKKKNSVCEFASERSESLIRNYRESLARQSQISIKKAFEDSVESPAPRFWVSEARAMRVITMLMKGKEILEEMHTEKQKMYLEIYRRVKELKEKNPSVPLGDILFDVINNEAPRSYLSATYAARIIKANIRTKGYR